MSPPPHSESLRATFAARRERFIQRMGGGVAVFPSARVAIRSNDVEFEYRQDNDLLYLTGVEEPESVLVLAPGHAEHRFVLFVRGREPDKEIWTGRRMGPEGAVSEQGADAAFPIEELEERLPGLIENAPRLFYRLGRDREFDSTILEAIDKLRVRRKSGVRPPPEIVDPGEVLHEQRLIKLAEEISLLRGAAELTCEAHRAAMAACRPGMGEYELEAVVEYVFRSRGSTGPGYPSIVGSGENATVLHYSSNQAIIRESHLVLIDAGCEWGSYTADVTRTFPASGSFSRVQRAVYEVVLEAQLAALEEVCPGAPFDAYHRRALRVLTEGMVRLGLLEGEVDGLIETEAYRRFYPHGTGHWLGLDVHDVGRYKTGDESRILEPGMVLTVEPGLYIQPGDSEAPEEFRGIGVRIEDDVLVTASGREVLSAAAPKLVEDVEEAVRNKAAAFPL